MFVNADKAVAEPDQQRFLLVHDKLSRDPKSAVVELKQLASDGSLASMLCLGYFYESGKFEPINYLEARAWYRKAADVGSIQAYYRLGDIFFREGSYDSALGALSYAVGRGYPPAMHLLGRMYQSGKGVSRDAARAEIFAQASDKGSLAARLGLSGILWRDRSSLLRMLKGLCLLLATIPAVIFILCIKGRGDERLL